MSTFFMGCIAPSIVLIPVAVATYKFKYWNGPEKMVMVYLLFCGLFNLIAKLTAHYNNLPLLHLYTILEFFILCGFFSSMSSRRSNKTFFFILATAFSLVALSYVLLTRSLFVYNALPRFLESLALTILCIHFFIYNLNRDLDIAHIMPSRFNFIAVTALLIYFSCCSTLFGLSNYFMRYNHDQGIDTIIWNIHAIFMSVMYLIFALAYLTLKKK